MEMLEDLTLFHFSHRHPLERTKSPPTEDITCSGCNLNILSGKDYYNCKSCPFSLHRVCYNMQRKIRHPAHPNHHLALLVMPPSVKGTFKCKACEQHVTGFYYNCARCGIFYHILCSVLPLSVAISSHHHRLKLEFSPPYDFSCDLCNKPSYNGWLYRCDICEFDTHLACAISNQRAESLQHHSMPQPNTLTRHSMHSVAALMDEADQSVGSKDNELMQLIAQGLVGGIKKSSGQETVQSAVGGRHDALDCPKESIESNISGGWIRLSELYQTKPDMAGISSYRGRESQSHDQSTMVSEELTTPSHQFSSCFSIELAKTYPSAYCIDQVSKEASSYHRMRDVPEIKKAFSFGNSIMPNRIMGDSKQANQEPNVSDKPGFDFHSRGTENRLNGPSLIEGGTNIEKLGKQDIPREANGSRRNTGISNQNAKSDIVRSRGCWWKLFQFCC